MGTAENNWEIIFLVIFWNIFLLVSIGFYGASFDENGVLNTPQNCTSNCTNINVPNTGAIDFLLGLGYGLGAVADQIGWFFTFLFSTIWIIIDAILIFRLIRSG